MHHPFQLPLPDQFTSGGDKRIKKVAKELLGVLKTEKLRIENWREKETTRDAIRVVIREFLWDDKKGVACGPLW
jgi:type I restriction enzyme R subunit